MAERTKSAKGGKCKSSLIIRLFILMVLNFFSKDNYILYADVAQLARVSAFQAEGCGFETRHPLHMFNCRPELNWGQIKKSHGRA